MTFEEVWNKYLKDEDMSAVTDDVLALFQAPLPEEIYQNYEVGELIVDYVGYYETVRGYDKIQELATLLRDKHPPLYRKEHAYFNEALINYYCFRRDTEALRPPVQDFVADTGDYDLFLMSFKRLVYYNHRELVNTLVTHKFPEVAQNENLLGQTELNLSSAKHAMLLEDLCATVAANGTITDSDWQQFRQAVLPYQYEFEDKPHGYIKTALEVDNQVYVAALQEDFPGSDERTASLLVVRLLFMRAVQPLGLSFPISDTVWHHLLRFWEERMRDSRKGKRINSWDAYFRLTEKEFKEFLLSQSGIVLDYRFEMALILWGSSYVFDFLHEQGLFSTERYEAQQANVATIKRGFKRDYHLNLWEYDFVHDWAPPRGVSAEDWEEEKQEFTDSFELDPGDSTIDRNPYFSSGSLWDTFSSISSGLAPTSTSTARPSPPPARRGKPAPTGPKIGRNERISVRYEDGTVREDVKYKKVANDLDAGKCELL